MFSMVASSGFVVLRQVKLNRRSLLIIAVSLGLSVGLNAVPQTLGILSDGLRLIFAETGVATATLVSILLDQLLPAEK
jgi:xanthine/uracil permease